MTDSQPVADSRGKLLQALWRAIPYLLVVVAIYMMWSPRPSGPERGSVAASFDLPVIAGSGDRLRLDDLKGQPVLIEVFASWCSSCRSSARTFNDVAAAQRQNPVHFMAVSVDDDPHAGRAAARDWGFPCSVAHDDGRFSRDYGIAVLPTMILLDAEGNVRQVSSGVVGKNKLEGWLSDVGAKRL
jgi:cytochrome c biogenesis protein CcmG/thiol:disulfide interchange protein DsbE